MIPVVYQENILFETKHPSFLVDLKRILITGVSLNLIFALFYRWSWTRVVSVLVLFALMDIITFYLPAISKKYIITEHCLIIKRRFGSKEIPFCQVGSISAAKGKILLVSMNGKVLTKIQEVFIDPSLREKFKDLLFQQMQKIK